MFAVIYQFQPKAGQEESFIEAWKELTQLIYAYEGSLGSRLHRADNGSFIAYAQWPSKTAWEASGNKLPEGANAARDRMKAACTSIQTIHQLETVEDLLQRKAHSGHNRLMHH